MRRGNTLNLSAGSVADIAWWYLIGQVVGALFFGRLSDKLGRRNLFLITLGVYLVGSGLTAATPAGKHWFIFLYATRVVAGMGIGGEYAAINSAIDEMMPARYRGRIDLAVNGTYWGGAILGTLVTLWVLSHFGTWGWRIGFLAGPILALCVIYVRHLIGTGQDGNSLFVGYVVGAGAMIIGGVAAIVFGVNAEGKSLEDVATPLSVRARPERASVRSDDRRGIDEAGPDAPEAGARTVPDPGLARHDDPAQTHRPGDDGPAS